MGLTATGYTPRTLADIVEALTESLRSTISEKIDLSERSVLGNITQIFAAHLVQVEELAAAAYDAFDVEAADDDRVVALGILIGVPRRGPTKGLVDATLNLGASFAGAAAGGLVAHVVDEPANRWVNRDAVPSGADASADVVFEAETAGAAGVAPSGTLTIIAGPVTGWNSITNAADATPGTDIEAIEALRLRMQLAVAAGGSRTRNAIRAKLVQLDGVLSAEVFENTTSSVDADGIPPHAIRAVVWDGSTPAADDDEIAQVLWDTKAEGILSDGGESGTAQDEVLGPVTVNFERATEDTIAVAVNIKSADGVAIADVKAAILAAMPNRVGAEVTFNKLSSSVFNVPGVDDWVTFTIDGGTADKAADINTIYTLSSDDVVVTGDVS